MKLIVPNYYQKFKCIAGKCQHSCCIGWEIDIDEDTLEYYRGIPGELGQRLSESISQESTPHFILGEQERCPFLDKRNLCDIVTALGEDALCRICADHPRFRNYFSDRTEMGLGLCCEAAGRLILGQKEKAALISLEEDGFEEPTNQDEQYFFILRKQLFSILQDREQTIEQRLTHMLTLCGGKTPHLDWKEVYKNLERLDPAWDERLKKLNTASPLPAEWEIPLEQLAVYFAYRHLAGALEDGRLAERAAFIALSVRIIYAIAAAEPDLTLETFIEIARLYSSEIEYSDENIEVLLNKLTDR